MPLRPGSCGRESISPPESLFIVRATVRGATKPMPVVASAMTPRMDAASHVGHSTRRIGRTTDGPGSTRFLRRCRCAVSWHRRPPRWPARARSSTDRASDYGSEGWGFDSLRAHARLRQAGAPHPHPRCGALPLPDREYCHLYCHCLGSTAGHLKRRPSRPHSL